MLIAGSIIVLIIAGYGGLTLALRNNPHAVLDTVDRIVGPSNSVAQVHEASTGADPQQRVLVHRAGKTEGPLPVLVFFHGGSWAHGDPQHYGFAARSFAEEGFIVVLGGYRLGERGRYPAMLEDTAAAVAWVHQNIAEHGGDPERIFLGGHSAGAYNVAQVALEPRWLETAGVPSGAVRGVIGLAGPYDFYPYDSASTEATFGSVGAGEESQPVNHARADAPPLLLVHGEQDTLVKPRNSRALAAAMADAGGQAETLFLPDGDHNAPLLALANPWRRDPTVRNRVIAFLRDKAKVSVPVQPQTP
ncbi:alpha/beta hydrolase [Qipengyuania sp. 1NDW9]|uniref:alpha/beta hydrolase n=1 Tax=Qipengyuania xiapuensis TaxID=2867236 RepID=UPI001C86ADDE|nr:alpha/beta hydrolase [Qipengyuania xiapuensis]MBX7491769.1 alpha/beta hydrolase [Qipengyuania xiapuensis]